MIRLREAKQKDYTHVVDWTEGPIRKRKFFRSFKAAKMFHDRKRDAMGMIPQGEPPATPEEFAAVLYARREGVPLMEAATHWKRTAGAHGGRTMEDLIAARLESSEADALSDHYRTCLARVLSIARESMGRRMAVEVTPTDCQAFISRWPGHAARKQARTILGSVFTHAARMGWLTFNPAGALKLARRVARPGVSLFSPEDAAEWLCCVAAHAPACLAGWAIALFAGLRRAEVERLDWSEVKIERGFIEVTARKSKTKSRRLVDIQPNLSLILAPLAGVGPVFPLSPKRGEDWARKAYGRAIPKNAARHSFVSYHLALFADTAATELQAGHDRAIMFQHYRELATREEAERYFTITL